MTFNEQREKIYEAAKQLATSHGEYPDSLVKFDNGFSVPMWVTFIAMAEDVLRKQVK